MLLASPRLWARFAFVLLAATAAAQQRSARGNAESHVEAPVREDWLSRISEEIRRDEYRFSALDTQLWSAPNRSQELRSRLDRNGIEVFPRETDASGAGAAWRLRLGTAAFGRDGDARPILPGAAGKVSVAGERAELDHGALIEWFVNDEHGIEQGWTIANRPAGLEALVIGLAIEGDLSLRLDDGGRSGVFVDRAGEPKVRYRDLIAWDATGRELPARMRPTSAGVEVHVNDAGAVYPVTVDPLLTNAAWTVESNQAHGFLGVSVSSAGDVNGDGYSDVIVGAHGYDNGEANEGRAYVYHGSVQGLELTEAWTAESNQVLAQFGFAVSTAGDVNGDGYSDVIIGARLYDNGEMDEGRAYVYHGSATGLEVAEAWSAESNQGVAWFGSSVSTAGDVDGDGYSDVIVGAYLYDDGEQDEGRAYVAYGSASGLGPIDAWTAESNQASAQLGFSVSTAGDVNGDGYSDVIVGAFRYDNGGRAYVYHGSAAGLGAVEAWTADSDQALAGFGYSVSTAGDVNGDGYTDVVVGAMYYDNGSNDEGRAYVYHGSATGLGATETWTAESNNDGARFGRSVSTAGDVNGDGFADLIVGAYLYGAAVTGEGRAYVYHGSALGLGLAEVWSSVSNQAGAHLGVSVSTAGDVNGDGYADVIVGANDHDNGETDEGRAYVYHGSATGLSATEGWTAAELTQSNTFLGVSVSTAGDVNGDGYSDLLIGAHGYDNGETNEGRAYVYHGSASGPELSPAWSAESNQSSAFFGGSVSTAGDVNGDGYSDVLVGASAYDNGEIDEGRAYVFHGSASGLGPVEAWTAESNHPSARFGTSVSTAGDVNGDGYSDVIVGSPYDDNGEIDEGLAFVYHGSATGLGVIEAWIGEPDQAGAFGGVSVSTAGDVNGDGYSDVIVGANRYDNGESDEGRAFVYLGSAGGLEAVAAWTAESNQTLALFGRSVSTAGDVNGDGYSDVIVGSWLQTNGESDEGQAFVYHGSAAGLGPTAAWSAESNQANAALGVSAASAGDVNGDGYSDVVVGAYRYGNGEFEEGRAYVYHGSATGLSATEAWTAESNQAGAWFGLSVSSAGDVNGDGYSDVIVGALSYDNAFVDQGRVYVYYGNGGDGGLVRSLQQRNRTGTRPISVLGIVALNGLFRLRAEFPSHLAAHHWPTPDPNAWLEWELKPLGVPFDGTSIECGTPQALSSTSGVVTFDEPVHVGRRNRAAFLPEIVFHWRARVATNNPLFAHTAWFSVPGNHITESKLRKPATVLR